MVDVLTLLGIVVGALVFLALGYLAGAALTNFNWQNRLPKLREEAIQKSRAVLGGKFSEQLAPFLPGFPYRPTEARFIGSPIDFVIFSGLDEKSVSEVVFVEVKSGKSQASAVEKTVRDAVMAKRVKWAEYRVPETLTAGKA